MMNAGLLRSEQVQKELKLTEDQVKKLTELQEKGRNQRREMFGGLRDKSPEERQAAFTKMREKMQEMGKKSSGRYEQDSFQRATNPVGSKSVFRSVVVVPCYPVM